MTGPHQLCYVNCGLPADECYCYRDIMSRAGDPAALAALPEVQAMIAAAYEVAAGVLDAECDLARIALPQAVPVLRADARDIRALTPADATAAIAARDAAMRARGMREAAEMIERMGFTARFLRDRAAEIERGAK